MVKVMMIGVFVYIHSLNEVVINFEDKLTLTIIFLLKYYYYKYEQFGETFNFAV